ncbi:MAG: hypothetical protein AAB436_03170 [Patescibacteria group bacterium]
MATFELGNHLELVMYSSALSKGGLIALHDGPLKHIEGLDLCGFTRKGNGIRAMRKMAKLDHIDQDAWSETVTELVDQVEEAKDQIMQANLGSIVLTGGGLAIPNPDLHGKTKKRHEEDSSEATPSIEPKFLFLAEALLIELGVPSETKEEHDLYNPRGLTPRKIKDMSLVLSFAEIIDIPEDEGLVVPEGNQARNRRKTDHVEPATRPKHESKASKKAMKKAAKKAAKAERKHKKK